MSFVRALTLLAAAGLTACGSTGAIAHPAASTPPSPLPPNTCCTSPATISNPDYQGPVTATHKIGTQGEVWTSPAVDQLHPKATWQSIWSHLCGGTPAACDPKGPVTIVLARVTLPFPAKLNHDGTSTREFVDRLMYVFTTTGVPCSPLGGPMRVPKSSPSTSPTPRQTYTCVSRSYYDAATGHFWSGSNEGMPA